MEQLEMFGNVFVALGALAVLMLMEFRNGEA